MCLLYRRTYNMCERIQLYFTRNYFLQFATISKAMTQCLFMVFSACETHNHSCLDVCMSCFSFCYIEKRAHTHFSPYSTNCDKNLNFRLSGNIISFRIDCHDIFGKLHRKLHVYFGNVYRLVSYRTHSIRTTINTQNKY